MVFRFLFGILYLAWFQGNFIFYIGLQNNNMVKFITSTMDLLQQPAAGVSIQLCLIMISLSILSSILLSITWKLSQSQATLGNLRHPVDIMILR